MITEASQVPWEVGFDRRLVPETPKLRVDLNASTVCPDGFARILGKDGKPCVAVVAPDGTLQHIKVNENSYSQGRNATWSDLINSLYMSGEIQATKIYEQVVPLVVRRRFTQPTVYLAGISSSQ